MSRRARLLGIVAVFAFSAFLTIAAGYFFVFWPVREKHPALRLPHGTIAVRGATIYVSPDQPPLRNGTLVARDGRITAVGGPGTSIPSEATMLSCEACAVTAGFWNMHVHFTESKWNGVEWQNKRKLEGQIADMLTSRGFTTVVDLGSDPRSTISLRRRIENGEFKGPLTYTAGAAIYPENGIPFYVRETTPRFMLFLMPQPATPDAATRDVGRNIGAGADVLKLFTGTYVARGTIKPMRADVAKAAVAAAHEHGQVAFAHPSNLAGVTVALESGVDVLAHTPDTTDGIDDRVITQMAQRASMVPTLKMFGSTVTKKPAYLEPIYSIVTQFRASGGNLLFGTDVGYMNDYSTEDEFGALAHCGLSSPDVLRMLTVGPAARMGVTREKGTLEPGKLADFVVLRSDPGTNVKAFADVRATVRNGTILWRSAH